MSLPAPRPDSTCLITGASSGIGAEIAKAIAKRGHGLTLLARRTDRLEVLAGELSTAHGVRVETLGADVSDPAARDELPRRLTALGLTVDVLVNNAGFGTIGQFVALDAGREVNMVRVNVEAVVALCGAFTPAMVERGEGAVLNVASTTAFQPIPGEATYSATKAFVLTFTEALHAELAGSGVTVTALCPGPVRTEFMDAPGMDEGAALLPKPMWVDAADVAESAVRGLERGHRVVVPGAANVASTLVGQHTPRWLLLPALRRIGRLGR